MPSSAGVLGVIGVTGLFDDGVVDGEALLLLGMETVGLFLP